MDLDPYNEKRVSELKDSWEQLCRKKVTEAYKDYMRQHKLLEE